MSQVEPKLVPAVERATRILDLVARNRIYPTLSDISRELGIAKSTVHTLCRTLVELNLLIRRRDHSFQLGPHLMRWSNAFTQQSDLATEFASIWDKETEMPGATITLSVLEGNEVVYIAARNSDASHPLIDFRVGMRLPAAFTATGKSFLSHMSDFEVKRLFGDGLPEPCTPNSVQSIDQLLSELRETRKNKYSVDNQQVADGLICFGASVLDSRNTPIAGVAVSLLVDDVTESDRERIIEDVRRIATKLSERMGADLDGRARPEFRERQTVESH
jgi:IclR family transcriptional regulator, blcABC operon repressor